MLAKVGECARAGVDHIQLREKDLSARELEKLALAVASEIRAAASAIERLRVSLAKAMARLSGTKP